MESAMGKKDTHCSYCGSAFAADASWPRTCASCKAISYKNPLPVAVLLVPVGAGLLLVRRAIEPRRGSLALPGGYINHGESWQDAAARELFEETGVRVSASGVQHFATKSAPDGTLLVFGVSDSIREESLPTFVPTDETSEIVVAPAPTELAFSLHTETMRAYFKRAAAS
jgi:ADP-ribose pyrophosphatase YjhB (NUDIX family)